MLAFYNWVKQQQCTKYIHPKEFIVDLGSGRGYDVQKLQSMRVKSILNIDCDRFSVEDGSRKSREWGMDNCYWYMADLLDSKSFKKMIEEKLIYIPQSVNTFWCQSSLHLLFRSKDDIVNLLGWMNTFLTPGGYFIGTCLDGDEILKLFGDSINYKSSCVKIELDPSISDAVDRDWNHRATLDGKTIGLIYWSLLVPCAESMGFKLISTEMFDSLYKRYNDSNLTRDEMKYSFVNRSFVFQKK